MRETLHQARTRDRRRPLRRCAQLGGQKGGVHTRTILLTVASGETASIGEDADCRQVLTQLAAVSKALDRAGFAITANAMRDCVTGGEHDDMDAAEIEKLFLSLS